MELHKEIDWTYWTKCEVVPLGFAVLLSLGVDPLGLDLGDNEFGPFAIIDANSLDTLIHYGGEPLPIYHQPDFSEKKWKLYHMALACIGRPKGLLAIDMPYSQAPINMPHVRLKEFGKWLLRIKFPVPNGFPAGQCDPLPSADGTTTLALPYRVEFFEDLRDIINDNYASLKEGDKPNQKKVALEIDRAMGWTNQKKNEIASRTAITIASRLQPAKFQSPKK